jgi:hypothetical protein
MKSSVITRPRVRLLALLIAGLSVAGAGRAATGASVVDDLIQRPQRLSEWLTALPASSERYPLGLMWMVPAERVTQARQRDALRQQLATLPKVSPRLAQVLGAMPVTGRVPTDAAQGRWLEVNPARDPVLQPGDRVQLSLRPSTVLVLRANGQWCPVEHVESASAQAYVQACEGVQGDPGEQAPADWAWIVQPDGRVQKMGIAPWNLSEPVHLAPGAWIWAPAHDAEVPEPASLALAQWLATQGASGDVRGAPVRRIQAAPASLLDDNQRAQTASQNLATSSDWGVAGLLQTPTARMREPGTVTLHFHRIWPYTHGNVFFQPLEDLEFGFRYTDVANRAYGPADVTGEQSYKDKSIDLKLRLLHEGRYLPEVAAGVLDLGGTGLFGSEYLVANKRWNNVDASLGLAWGYLGGRQDMRNPLSVLGQRWTDRPTTDGSTGKVSYKRYFRGPVGWFGGVQYQLPDTNWLLKLEYDGNNYQREPQDNAQSQSSPINMGAVYRLNSAMDLMLGYERGNRFSIGFSLHSALASLHATKTLDPAPVPVSVQRPVQSPPAEVTATDLARQTDWQARAMALDGSRLSLDVANSFATYERERLDRAWAVLHRDAPASVQTLEIRHQNLGGTIVSTEVDREAWVRSKTEPARSSQPADPLRVSYPAGDESQPASTRRVEFEAPALSVRPGLDFIQTIGGPDGFVLYQFSGALRASAKLPLGWQSRGTVRLRLFDNYERFQYDGPSELPRVRTYLREYLTTSRVTLDNLSLFKAARLSRNTYYAVYGGYFESMYGGVGAEGLYRQAGSRWAVGVDVNRVRQRNFEQDFGFRPYQVSTGHATLYWDTGWEGVRTSVSAGRYLAGDRGATVSVAKVFANGVSMMAFATKTNVSAAQFGEGSFDKGIVLRLPFDVFLPRSSASTASFVWKPLTRDGGAMVARPVSLADETTWLDPDTFVRAPAAPVNSDLPPDDRIEPWARMR